MPPPSHQLEVRLLGSVEAFREGAPVVLAGRKARALLLHLALRAGELVASDVLIEELWSDTPPRTPENTLQVHVSQLRKALGEAAIVTREGAYELAVAPEQVDARRFEQLAAAGREQLAAGEASAAATAFRDALGLWRGPVFGGLEIGVADRLEGIRLEELRLSTLEDRFEAELALGADDGLVADLRLAVGAQPLRERLQASLMRALYRAGRQAEALEVYRQVQRRLADELGLEPSPLLRALERSILTQDAALGRPASPSDTPAAARPARKHVTVVACEVGEHGLDPEAGGFEAALELVRETLIAQGASVETTGGRAVTAVFGVPSAHEDEAVRASHAVLECRSRLARIALRAGIASGEVLVEGDRISGGPLRAASLQLERAAPGEIVLDEETATLLGSSGTIRRDRDGATVLLAIDPSAPPIPRRFDTELVGRDRELALLLEAFETTVAEGSAAAVNVVGPAGIGKSRIAHEFRTAVGARASVLVGRCASFENGAALRPLAEMLAQAVPGDLREGLHALLGVDAGGARAADVLAAAFELGESTLARGELDWAIRSCFQALADREPLVLVFDDTQWASDLLLESIAHLLTWAAASPILVVCLARPEFAEERPDRAPLNAQTIDIAPLSAAETEALIELVSHGQSLGPGRRGEITAAAEGNPLFIEQIVALVATQPSEASWRLPPTIHALLAARLDLLPAPERELLARLSVAGREIDVDEANLLAEGAGGPELDDLLPELVEKQLLEPPSEHAGRVVYRFRHRLIADAAYDSLTKAARTVLHERFADWLELRAEGRLAEVDERVGRHLARAVEYRRVLDPDDAHSVELAERAARRLSYAGRRAYARFDMRAANTLFEQALALAPEHVAERPERLLDLAMTRRDLGEFAGAEELAVEVERAAERTGEIALGLRAAVLRLRMRSQIDPEARLEELEAGALDAIHRLEDLDDPGALAEAEVVRGWAHWIRCRARETEQAVLRALDLSLGAGAGAAVRQGYNLYLGAALFGPLPVPEGIRRCESVLAAPPDRATQAAALRALAGLRAMEGRFEDARALLRQDREIVDELGLRVAAATASEVWAMIELLDGDPRAAEEKLREADELLRQLGETSTRANVTALLAETLFRQGRLDEALELAGEARQLSSDQDVCAQVYWRGPAAKTLAQLGRLADAEETAREAIALAGPTDFSTMRANAFLDLALVLRIAGRETEWDAAVREALALLDGKGNVAAAAYARRTFSASTG